MNETIYAIAAALVSPADEERALLDSRGGAERFTVGDVSVSGGSGGAALREQAAALLAPFDGGGFVFVGVDG